MPSHRSKKPVAPEPALPSQRPGSKGRPTPSRKEAQAARKRPLVPDDRKEAKRRSREASREQRVRVNRALETGDEANLPAQHKGPQRRFARDLVDARRNVGEYFLIGAFVAIFGLLLVPMFAPQVAAAIAQSINLVLIAAILLIIADSLLLRAKLRRALEERFGSVERGVVGYSVMRALQVRRWRLPRPQVKHGAQI